MTTVGGDLVARVMGDMNPELLDFDGATALATAAHRFYIDSGNSPRRGREYRSQTYTAYVAGATPLAQTDTAYLTTLAGAAPFTYARAVTQTTQVGQATRSTLITYTHDVYGNRTAQFEYGDSVPGGDERRTLWAYAVNPITTTWIVNKPAQAWVYTGLSGGLAAQTRQPAAHHIAAHLRRVDAGRALGRQPVDQRHAHGLRRLGQPGRHHRRARLYDDDDLRWHLSPVPAADARRQRLHHHVSVLRRQRRRVERVPHRPAESRH